MNSRLFWCSPRGRFFSALCELAFIKLDPRDRDVLHHDRGVRAVIGGGHVGDGAGDIHAVDDLSEDGVLGLAAGEPVEKIVVRDVDEELAAAAVGLARVGHRQGAGRVGVAADVLVLNVAAVGARLRAARRQVLEGPILGAARARAPAFRVLRVRAPELCWVARGRRGSRPRVGKDHFFGLDRGWWGGLLVGVVWNLRFMNPGMTRWKWRPL